MEFEYLPNSYHAPCPSPLPPSEFPLPWSGYVARHLEMESKKEKYQQEEQLENEAKKGFLGSLKSNLNKASKFLLYCC